MVGSFGPKDLVFVDETGAHTAFARLHARARRGERAYGDAPRGRGQAQTLIAAISFEAVIADMVIAGGTSGDVFVAFVREVLAPGLEAGRVVVMDNLAARKRAEARTLIEAAGRWLVFLPSYSPDFNPIEGLFARLKGRLGSLGARCVGASLAGVGLAHGLVSGALVRGWFAGCGYDV